MIGLGRRFVPCGGLGNGGILSSSVMRASRLLLLLATRRLLRRLWYLLKLLLRLLDNRSAKEGRRIAGTPAANDGWRGKGAN